MWCFFLPKKARLGILCSISKLKALTFSFSYVYDAVPQLVRAWTARKSAHLYPRIRQSRLSNLSSTSELFISNNRTQAVQRHLYRQRELSLFLYHLMLQSDFVREASASVWLHSYLLQSVMLSPRLNVQNR